MIIKTSENPYGDLFRQYVQKEFPKFIASDNDLLEILTNIILGTKDVRYGPLPLPESLVVIRKVLRDSIELNHPIPILIPWGSVKPDFSSILDIAEVSAINRLMQLSDCISKYHPAGIKAIVRIEDTSGAQLFAIDNPHVESAVMRYSSNLVNLFAALHPTSEIYPLRESAMPNANYFHSEVNSVLPLFEKYLNDSDGWITNNPGMVLKMDSYKALAKYGWKGTIPHEQREHYYETYRRYYLDNTKETMNKRLATYMAQALSRRTLDMTGKHADWTNFIQLTFVPPIKGLPTGYDYNYVYYRTLNMSQARTHMAPWRAKGYFKINGNTLTPKITSFNSEIVPMLTPATLTVENGSTSILINTPYIIES